MRLSAILSSVAILLTVSAVCDRPDEWELVLDEDPAWSPDGTQIAFVRRDSTGRGLYVIDSSGQNERLVLEGNWISPGWSPDGRWLVFSTAYVGTIYKVKADSDSLTRLTFEGSCFYPDWSVKNRIAYDSNENDPKGANVLWLMDQDGSNRRDISEHGLGEWRCPSWASDGSRILFLRYYPGGQPEPDLAIIDSAGTDQERLTNDSSDYRRPRWSPDGRTIAVSRCVNYEYRLWILDLSTQHWTKLPTPHSGAYNAFDPTWSPDGKRICFSLELSREVGWGRHQTCGRIWMVDRDGTNLRQLTTRP
ncbi:MAG: PD40 domain-containing protein [candidate division WOR-3 bacterium]|nr:MAG: PD40 domain-containing protein [candidate division WOR-3 bacterium]